ncbi:MAG: ABC transporter substrate-binding protein [Lachnospiraceae bacterium]|nr:ABC transporter substrate-binding protein [Lachnospiraceae bacterium]
MIKKYITIIISLLFCICLFGCRDVVDGSPATSEEETGDDEIVIGFSQLGAESDWRSANTESMKEAFSNENGYKLIFEDGQQKQSNQITAIRTFIQQEVDYIVLAPVTETGWDTVLQEAKDAGIPVILVDRMIDIEDESLFTCWVGSDFGLEGRKITSWLERFTYMNGIKSEDIHIVNIQGTLGASSQIGRTEALRSAVKEYGWDLVAEVSGDFTQAKSREVMAELLEKHDNINVVYCENDNEALGAIEAIEAAGKKVGSDIRNGEIMILSFDGVNEEALAYLSEGKITCIAECNPLQGPRIQAVIALLEVSGNPDKFSYVEERIYSMYTEIRQVTVDGKLYEVTFLE